MPGRSPRIYANEKQREKGKIWETEGKKIRLHFHNEAFSGDMNVYSIGDRGTEYIGTFPAEDGWVTFEAEGFSVCAVTRAIEKTVTADVAGCRVTVRYDSRAGIPDGAQLEVTEIQDATCLQSAVEALHIGEMDSVYYARFLDISMVHDGETAEPAAPVFVTVELPDAGEGAEAMQVVRFGGQGTEIVESEASVEGKVTFTASAFSVYGFISVLRALQSWSGEDVFCVLQGFSAEDTVQLQETDVLLEEGLEQLVACGTQDEELSRLWLRAAPETELKDRESLAVYSLENGRLGALLSEATSGSLSVRLNGTGFALVRDSGYRHWSFELEGDGSAEAVLDGMMPKAASASIQNVTEGYQDVLESGASEADGSLLLAVYDFAMSDGEEDYVPDEEHPVLAQIRNRQIAENSELKVLNLSDGTAQPVEGISVSE